MEKQFMISQSLLKKMTDIIQKIPTELGRPILNELELTIKEIEQDINSVKKDK